VGIIVWLSLSLGTSNADAASLKKLFGCKKCSKNVPIDSTPRIGDLIDKRSGAVLYAGEQCFVGLDQIMREDTWGAWQGTQAQDGQVRLEASLLAELIPIAQLEARGNETVTFGLTEPVHINLPVLQALQAMDGPCLDALALMACQRRGLKSVRLVSDVYAAGSLDVTSDSGWGIGEVEDNGDITSSGTIPIQGTQLEVSVAYSGTNNSTMAVSSEQGMLLGYKAIPLAVPAHLKGAMEEACR